MEPQCSEPLARSKPGTGRKGSLAAWLPGQRQTREAFWRSSVRPASNSARGRLPAARLASLWPWSRS